MGVLTEPVASTSGSINAKNASSVDLVSDHTNGIFLYEFDTKSLLSGSTSTISVLGRDEPFLVKMDTQKQWYQEPALYISAFAIIFSIISLWVNLRVGFNKDQRARRQSIEDEFFLRKVLYPLAIEPALEHYSEMLSSLPPDRFDASATAAAIDEFKKEFEKENSAIVAKMVTLGILGSAFLASVKLELEAIEDLISEYCFENSLGYNPASTTTTNTRSSVENQVAGSLVAIMKAIKVFQESVK